MITSLSRIDHLTSHVCHYPRWGHPDANPKMVIMTPVFLLRATLMKITNKKIIIKRVPRPLKRLRNRFPSQNQKHAQNFDNRVETYLQKYKTRGKFRQLKFWRIVYQKIFGS